MRDATREGLANAVLTFARAALKDELGGRVPAVAAITLAVAALRAVGQASGDATPAAARELFRMELAECAGAEAMQALSASLRARCSDRWETGVTDPARPFPAFRATTRSTREPRRRAGSVPLVQFDRPRVAPARRERPQLVVVGE